MCQWWRGGALLEDDQILARIQKGDMEAFEAFMKLYEDRVYTMAYRQASSPEDAAEITQDAFVRIWKSAGSFRGGSSVATWIYRITMNVCIDYARKEKTRIVANSLDDLNESVRDVLDLKNAPDRVYTERERREELHQMIAELPEVCRQVLVLREVSGLSYDEIANVLEVSLGTVKSRLSRARLMLRKKICNHKNFFDFPSSNNIEGGDTHE